MKLSLSPTTIEVEGSYAVGDTVAVNGTATITNLSTSQTLGPGGEVVEEAFGSLLFDQPSVKLATA